MSFWDQLPGVANFALSAAAMPAQWLGNAAALGANQQRYDQGYDELAGLRTRRQGDIDSAAGAYTQGANALVGDVRSGVDNINRQTNALWNQRYVRNMRYLEGAGQQERRDINRGFDNNLNSSLSGLRSRGLIGSTINPAVRAGNQRRRADALGGLDERLRQQRLSWDSSLSGDVANNFGQGAWSGFNAVNTAQQNALNTGWNTELARGGVDTSNTGNLVNWIGNRTDSYPDQSAYLNTLYRSGQSQAPIPNYPSPSYGPGIAQGLSSAAGAAIGKAFVGCIDAATPIDTPAGPRPLAEILIGDQVMTLAGPDEVVDRDCGAPWPQRRWDYLTLYLAGGAELTLTRDHLVNGRAAGDYQVGDSVALADGNDDTLVGILHSAPVVSGDLRLAHSDHYLTAEGIIVGSMLEYYGISAMRPRPAEVAK